MINSSDIDFFKDLTQLVYKNNYYDLHNNYDCTQIDFCNKTLLLKLKSIKNEEICILKFINASIAKMFSFNIKDADSLTINILYRGRFEYNGELLDVTSNNQSYFYLEFEEGQQFEFFGGGIIIESDIPKK